MAGATTPVLVTAVVMRPAVAATGAVGATDAAASVTAKHLADLAPIDDVRGTGAYRRDAALTLLRRAIAQAVAA